MPYKTEPNRPCTVAGCTNSRGRRGRFCNRHDHQFRKYGDPTIRLVAPAGSGYVHGGYRRVTINGRRVMEHRLIWESVHGPIPPDHDIHHKNGNRSDNSIENLECIQSPEHSHQHMAKNRDARTHCVNGHRLTPENIYKYPNRNAQECRVCRAMRSARAVAAERKARLLSVSL